MSNAEPSPSMGFIGAETEGGVYRCTVEGARSILGADTCRFLVAEGDRFLTRASAPPESIGTTAPLPIADTTLEEAASRGSPTVIDDVSDVRGAAATASRDAGTGPYRSVLIVPSGMVGSLLAADHREAYFSDDDVENIERLLSYAEVALDRIRSQARRNARGERLTEIVGTYAHDLRSPLQVAMGHVALALESGDQVDLERVSTAHERMNELLGDMSRLASSGKNVEDLREVELARVAEEAWTTVPTADATLDVEDSRVVEADGSRLRQLLENLFQNAVDHGSDHVHVRVGTFDAGFYVEDDGPGIPVEDREDVFRWETTSAGDHSGLGLSIVHRIVTAHGWEVTITESGEGGTRFEITT